MKTRFSRMLHSSAACLVALSAAPALSAHPSLFYGPGDVAGLRTKAAGTHQTVAHALTEATAMFIGSRVDSSGNVSWNSGRALALGDRRDIGNALIVFAFSAQISTDPGFAPLAHDWLMTICGFSSFDLDGTHDLVQAHLLWGVSIAYDMLAPSLSGAESHAVQTAIQRNANELVAAGHNGAFWSSEFQQNHNWINHGAVGIAALATSGDLPSSTTGPWLDFAVANAKTVAPIMDGVVDGTWHEGFGYQSYGLDWHLAFVSALKRVAGTDLTDIGMVRGLGTARAYMQLPEAPNTYIVSNGDFFGFTQDDGLAPLRFAASTYSDGIAQAAADRWATGTAPQSYAPEMQQRVFEFLFYDPSVLSTDLHTQPLDWFGSDLQVAIFRSGWEPGATVFALKNGPYGGTSAMARIRAGGGTGIPINWGHDHADDNGFYLYGNGSWLAPEAAGYFIGHPDSPGPRANETVFHNSMTIDGAGQLGEGIRTLGDESAAYSWFAARAGGIPQFGSAADFAYALGDGSHLYPSALGLTQWDRQATYVDRKWIVLRDVVKASSSHVYRWTSHFMNGATQEGNWIHGIGQGGQSLGVAVVAPASWTATIDRQAPVNVWDLNPAGSVAVVQIAPNAAAADCTFLTVLIPTAEVDWSAKPTVTAIDPTAPAAGLVITDGSHVVHAVFSDPSTGSLSVGGFTLSGESGVVEYDGNAASRVMMVRGTQVSDAQHPLATQSIAAEIFEADGLNGVRLVLSGSGLSAGRIYSPRAATVTWNGSPIAFTRDGDDVVITGALIDGGTVAASGDGGGGGFTTSLGTPLDSPASSPAILASSKCGCTAFEGGAGSLTLGLSVLATKLARRRRPRVIPERNATSSPGR